MAGTAGSAQSLSQRTKGKNCPIHPQAQLPPQSSVIPDRRWPNCFAERTGVKVPLTKAETVVFSCQKAYKNHCSVWRVRKRTTGTSTLAMSITRTPELILT